MKLISNPLLAKIKLSILLVFFIFNSCTQISPQDLTIIDGVRLGMEENSFLKQLDSLNIKQENVYTDLLFNEYSELNSSKLYVYKTDVFNFGNYNSPPNINTYGIYYPFKQAGTENIIGLRVLLAHTNNASVISGLELINVTSENNVKGISQDLTLEHINQIEKMFTERYGKPTDTSQLFNNFYVIKGQKVIEYQTDEKYFGHEIHWKTKHMNINLFKGINRHKTIFNSREHSYKYMLESNPNLKLDYGKGEKGCNSYSFISYRLNDETIAKLELATPKL